MPPRVSLTLVLALFVSCSPGATHVAETTLYGVHLKAMLAPNHPYLAEYRRWVEVSAGGKTEKKEVFADTGGYAWIIVLARARHLEVYDLGGVEFSLPVSGVPDSEQYLGRFDFDAHRNYVFIPASVDDHDPSIPFRKET